MGTSTRQLVNFHRFDPDLTATPHPLFFTTSPSTHLSTLQQKSSPISHHHNSRPLSSNTAKLLSLLTIFSTTNPAPKDPKNTRVYVNRKSQDLRPLRRSDEDTGETKQSQNYIHIRIQQRNGRKTLTTVQGLPKKFDQKKILKVIKKKFACNGTIVVDTEMGEVIQLQGDQRKDVQEFLTDKKEGLELDAKTIKVHGF